MNLLCGSNIDQNNDTLYQFEEGQRAHTIKFISIPIKIQPDINQKNNNRIIKNQNFEFSNNTINQDINKEIILKNKTPLESNKCSNNTSELEIIEYPSSEFKKNDLNNINDIITSQAKDYINDKSQNNILDYLKEKQGLNYLSLLFENDKNSNKSKSDNNEKNKDNNISSSKSDEIICSYIEIDHNNSIVSRIQKEKSVIKKPKNIFTQAHQSSLSDYSLVLKNYNNSKNKIVKDNNSNTINVVNKSKNKNEDKKIRVLKNMKKNKTDMKFKKSVNFSTANTHLKKNRKSEGIKSLMDIGQNENTKNSDVLKSKKKFFLDKKTKIDTLRSIESLNDININPIHIKYKNIINALNAKPKKSTGKSQIINSERTNTNIQINLNSIIASSKDKDKNKVHNYIYKKNKSNKKHSVSKKKKININSKTKKIKNNNPLFNSITIKRSKNLNISKKANILSLKKNLLLSSMRVDSINKLKTENISTANSKSKLRKLLINNMNNSKNKCDLSMYNLNINSITNNTKLLIKKDNKSLKQIMNKSEAYKTINHSIQIKNSHNSKHLKNTLQSSISKLLKY
jgi:hypothetical protein